MAIFFWIGPPIILTILTALGSDDKNSPYYSIAGQLAFYWLLSLPLSSFFVFKKTALFLPLKITETVYGFKKDYFEIIQNSVKHKGFNQEFADLHFNDKRELISIIVKNIQHMPVTKNTVMKESSENTLGTILNIVGTLLVSGFILVLFEMIFKILR